MELYHYGVKGMKWGVRRSSGEIKADRNRRTNSNLTSLKTAANEAASGFRSAGNIAGIAGSGRRPSKAVKNELSTMSDQELRARINRMNMEQQYADLKPSRVSRGAAAAKATLEVAGNIAALGASALGIALAIRQLKGA